MSTEVVSVRTTYADDYEEDSADEDNAQVHTLLYFYSIDQISFLSRNRSKIIMQS